MNLKTIQQYFKTIKENEYYYLYAIKDKIDDIYPDYHGSTSLPFLGMIKKVKDTWIYVHYSVASDEGLEIEFSGINELKSLIKSLIAECEQCGVTTDCCNPTYNMYFRCACAHVQFIRNKTNFKFSNTYSSTICINGIEIKEDKHLSNEDYTIQLLFDDESFLKHKCSNPKEVIGFLKSILTASLLGNISSSINNLRKMCSAEVNADYKGLERDIIYKFDMSAFEIRNVGNLRDQMIGELENALQQLKSE